MSKHLDVLKFWFPPEGVLKRAAIQSFWFMKNPDFDKEATEKFLSVHKELTGPDTGAAARRKWRDVGVEGYLAEIIVIDQLSRNMFRNQPESFKFDSIALEAAKEARAKGLDKELLDAESPNAHNAALSFLYMPYMHSESKEDHVVALEELFNQPCLTKTLDFEMAHKRIIDMFGRYPHRNEILGRETTPEEKKFLEEDANAKF